MVGLVLACRKVYVKVESWSRIRVLVEIGLYRSRIRSIVFDPYIMKGGGHPIMCPGEERGVTRKESCP